MRFLRILDLGRDPTYAGSSCTGNELDLPEATSRPQRQGHFHGVDEDRDATAIVYQRDSAFADIDADRLKVLFSVMEQL